MGTEFITPVEWQQKVIRRLMQEEFEGCEAVRAQLGTCLVKNVGSDFNAFLRLRILEPMPATVLKRVPAGLAGFVDGSDAPIVVLLHVVDRICQVIEIYHAAGDQIMELPAKWVSLGTLMKNFP